MTAVKLVDGRVLRVLEDPDLAASMIAAAQERVVHGLQLRKVGITKDMILTRKAHGVLHRQHQAVYAWGTPDLSPKGRLVAAVLATWPKGVLGFHAAAYLWQGMKAPPSIVDVLLPTRWERDDRLIHPHRRKDVDVWRRHGLPVTSPLDTAFDLATKCNLDELERTLAEMRFYGHVTDAQLHDACERGGRPGVVAVRELLAREGGIARQRSNGEAKMLRLIREARMGQRFEVNHPRGPTTPDIRFPDAGVLIEVDHPASHGTIRDFERDKERDLVNDLEHRTLRPTTKLIDEQPILVISRVAAAVALGAREQRGPT